MYTWKRTQSLLFDKYIGNRTVFYKIRWIESSKQCIAGNLVTFYLGNDVKYRVAVSSDTRIRCKCISLRCLISIDFWVRILPTSVIIMDLIFKSYIKLGFIQCLLNSILIIQQNTYMMGWMRWEFGWSTEWIPKVRIVQARVLSHFNYAYYNSFSNQI